MTGETRRLAEFASGLTYDDIPAPVIAVTKACLIDTIGVALFGSNLPWSRAVEDFSRHVGFGGGSTILSSAFPKVSAPAAALANGTFAHAFEFDNLRQPSIGVHPGSTATVAALSIAEEYKISGRDFLTALVAGNECMMRTGLAAKGTSEPMGFHAPGQTGVFGSAIAASRIMGHDAHKTTMAIGIGGSLCSGLLAFAKAGNGGMVKRLHMGRAAEGGVTAASLAARGFEGPDVLLEGKFGYLDVYAENGDPRLLTDGLGSTWESLNIWFKMFPCHITAQSPVRTIMGLQRQHHFGPDDVSHIMLNVSEKVLSHHADRAPRDVGTAQYSVPFSVALSLFRDPSDPRAFLDGPDQDPRIMQLCQKIELRPLVARVGADYNAVCHVEVTLADGRILSATRTGLDDEGADGDVIRQVEEKFRKLTSKLPDDHCDALLARLKTIEQHAVRDIFGF